MDHPTTQELLDGLDDVRRSPADDGTVELIACRPATGEREVLDEAVLDPVDGLVGDMWRHRPSTTTVDGLPHPERQVTLMNSHAALLFAGDPARHALSGDQLYLDLDLSADNLPPGTRLALGSAVIEVSAEPHTGCAKFTQRFGRDPTRMVNSPAGRALNLRGINARVVVAGTVTIGDAVRKT